jgi:hypothetical protein
MTKFRQIIILTCTALFMVNVFKIITTPGINLLEIKNYLAIIAIFVLIPLMIWLNKREKNKELEKTDSES